MRRAVNPARENIAEIRTMLLQFRLWLVELVACAAGWVKCRELNLFLQDEVRYARRCVKQFVFLLAFAQLDPPPRRQTTHRPANTKPGFRCGVSSRRYNLLRHFLRGVELRTLKQIKTTLDDIDAIAARVAKRVRWRGKRCGFTPLAPPVRARITMTFGPEPNAADTS